MKHLRILMVCHMPWSSDLGGPRIQIDLADAFRRAGHTVDVFAFEQAFHSPVSAWMGRRWLSGFPRRAASYIRQMASAYDVIDAHQFNIPYTKKALGFRGALIARSVGLLPRYVAFARNNQPRASSPGARKILEILRDLDRWRTTKMCWRSFQACDVAILPNDSEASILRACNLQASLITVPFGLSMERRRNLWTSQALAEDRVRSRIIAFIGSWEKRKGSADWPQIVRKVRAGVPDAQFWFLGTGAEKSAMLQDLGLPSADWIKVVSRYRANELPALLTGATVGAFPSYLEGFGYGLLEMLAAGLPSVAYRTPGPSGILKEFNHEWLIELGDVEGFARKLIELVTLGREEYEHAVEVCARGTEFFRLEDVAERTMAAYASALHSSR